MKGYLGTTYDLVGKHDKLEENPLKSPEFYELKFTPVFEYEWKKGRHPWLGIGL